MTDCLAATGGDLDVPVVILFAVFLLTAGAIILLRRRGSARGAEPSRTARAA